MPRVFGILYVFLSASPLFGQGTDLLAIHLQNPDEVFIQLFENKGSEIGIVPDPFVIRSMEFFENHPDLNLAGDFDGDGREPFLSLLMMEPGELSSMERPNWRRQD